MGFIKLFATKNPDTYISTSIALSDTQLPCGHNNFICPNGFVLDTINSICYKILPNLVANSDDSLCTSSTLIQFYNDAEIDGFIQLLESGKI